MTETDLPTTGGAAEPIGTTQWHMLRLFEDGDIRKPRKVGGWRVIQSGMIPAIIDALRKRGSVRDEVDRR